MSQLLPAQGSQAGKAISNVPPEAGPYVVSYPCQMSRNHLERKCRPTWTGAAEQPSSQAAERHQMRNYAQQQHWVERALVDHRRLTRSGITVTVGKRIWPYGEVVHFGGKNKSPANHILEIVASNKAGERLANVAVCLLWGYILCTQEALAQQNPTVSASSICVCVCVCVCACVIKPHQTDETWDCRGGRKHPQTQIYSFSVCLCENNMSALSQTGCATCGFPPPSSSSSSSFSSICPSSFFITGIIASVCPNRIW